MLTVLGPGGIGKTRLVVELARRSSQGGRSWRFVDLAGTLEDPLALVAAAFGLSFATDQGARRQLLRALRAEPCVVVLDNAEHVLSEGQLSVSRASASASSSWWRPRCTWYAISAWASFAGLEMKPDHRASPE